MAHSENEIFLSVKNQWVIKPWKDMGEPETHITKWEKPKCYLLHDSDYMTFWKRQNQRDTKKIGGCQEFREGRDEQAENRRFLV